MRALLVAVLACVVSIAAQAQAQPPESADAEMSDSAAVGETDECENDYDTAGVVEVGGSAGLSWSEDLFTLHLSPFLGWFVRDRIELGLIVDLEYETEDVGAANRDETFTAALVFEPSYHVPIYEEDLFAFAGLGVGVGYDDDYGELDIVPRVGLNIEVGASGILTPAVRVPVLLGRSHGDVEGDFGVSTEFVFEAGFTTTL